MPHCTKCGTMIVDDAAYCPNCGQAQIVPSAAPGTSATQATAGLQENVAGLLCYLFGWITGLVFFVIDKRPYVRFHAAQSIVTFGGLHLLQIILGGWILGRGVFHWGLFGMGAVSGLIGLVTFVLWILLMVKAYQGVRFKVPLAGDIAEKLAAQ